MDPRDALVWVASWVPLRVADALGWLAAWIWWFVLPIRRRETADRLLGVLPGLDPRRVLTRMFHDITLSYFELLRWDREFRTGRPPSIRIDVDATVVTPGALLLSGHGGAWDLSLLASAHHVPAAIYLKTPASPWVSAWLRRLRAEHGLLGLETGATQADGYAALAAGRGLYFVQDQRFAKGVRAPFFGRPALTSAGLAAAYLKTGLPIYVVWPERLGLAHHRIRYWRWEPPPLTGDREADILAVTAGANRVYEECIRACPHGWLWLHRRWKGGTAGAAG